MLPAVPSCIPALLPPPRWVSVLQNSKDEALSNAFKGEPNGGAASAGSGADGSVQELTKLVISEVKNMPGNKQCCDCGAPGRLGLWDAGGRRGWGGREVMLSPPPRRPHVALHQPGHPDVH